MIHNQQQYEVTKLQAENFARALQSLDDGIEIHRRVAKARREAIQSQLDELRAELAAYDAKRLKDAT